MARLGRVYPASGAVHHAAPIVGPAVIPPTGPGAPFRQDIYGSSAMVIVELAVGANLTASPSTWVWTDVTADVMQSPGLVGSWGRQDETSQSQPASMAFSLLNQSGAYSIYVPGNLLAPSTPVRVRRSLGTGPVVEFQGYAIGFTPTWDTSGKLPIVQVAAAGMLRRLGQPKGPNRSALYRSMSTLSNLIAFWPMEDGSTSTTALPAVGLFPLKTIKGTPAFGAQGPAGGVSGIDFTNSAVMTARVRGCATTSWRILFAWKSSGSGSVEVDPLYWNCRDGSVFVLRFVPGGGVFTLNMDYVTSSGTFVQAFVTPWSNTDQSWHSFQIVAVQNGADVDIAVAYDDTAWHPATATAILVGTNLAAITSVSPGQSDISGALPTFSLSSLAVVSPTAINPNLTNPDIGRAVTGYTGETASARLSRLFAEQGITFTLNGTSNIPMGPQLIDTLLNNARDCEKVDGGVLYDGFTDGCGYICRSARYNMTAVFSIDAGTNSQLAPPFAPVDDDQRTVNEFQASRSGGQTVTYDDTVTPMKVNAIGTYAQSDSFNLADDTFLLSIASWRVNLGTVFGLRYPSNNLNLINIVASVLAAAWLTQAASSMPIGFRVDLLNVATSALNHPPGTVQLILEGYSVTSNTVTWDIAANCVPNLPWTVAAIGDASNGRIDAANSTCNAGHSAGTPSFGVSTLSGPLWTTAGGDFPFDINIGGEQMTVTNITGSSSPQTFTVTRAVNGVSLPTTAGEPVHLWTTAVIGL